MVSQLIRYGLVGVVNTVITFLVIAVLTSFEINPYVSNAVGFSVGLINSFFLNSRFTFQQNSSANAALKFSLSFAGAYSLNILALHYLVSFEPVPIIAAQFLAMLAYNIAFFILMKAWVFARD